MLMIPEAWEKHTQMDENRRAFYEYHAAMMEPWDGPAAVAFTDGRQIGATLDRNGLRPARYLVTDDDLVVMASESGVLPIPEKKIVKKWRLQPGKMFLIDMEQGRIIDDQELKDSLANAKPYREWIEKIRIKLDEVPAPAESVSPPRLPCSIASRLSATPRKTSRSSSSRWSRTAKKPPGSMGTDSALPVLSSQEQDAVRLLQAAVRPGDQPADRPDPRRTGHVAGVLHRSEAEPAEHQRHQPADPSRSVAAGADLCRHGKAAQHREIHLGKFRSFELDICYPVAWGKDGIEAAWLRWRLMPKMPCVPAPTS
jgi:glutamate synthase (NADPH/NADH) large chain